MSGRRVLGCSLASTLGLVLVAVLCARAPYVARELGGGSELVYSVSGCSPDRIARVLEKRLHGLGLRAATCAVVETGVAVRLPDLSYDEKAALKKTLETNGQLDFKLVVGREQPEMGSDQAVHAMIEEVVRKKAEGSWLPYAGDDGSYDRYDVGYQRETRQPVLLENKGVSGSLLRDGHRALDSRGRPAAGFVFGTEGRNAFYSLTSQNVGRAMAIMLDGVIHSAPVIKSAIGEQGIIEGGADGFTEDEVRRLIVIFKAGALPGKIHFVQENARPGELGRTTEQAIAALVLGVALMGGILALTLPGQQPTAREKA